MNKPNLKLITLSILALPALAQAAVDPYNLSLEELMNIPVTVSSRKALSQRKTPGIVTVITGEEIRHSGARDLIDVLRLVPGMDFRVTVNNGIALGMRGHIGSDGRVLMLLDGIEINEHRYGSANFGQGFPVEQIARIEIIRGSALALYGGTALLGVINITSKSAEELDGVHAGAGLGYADSGAKSREYASLMLGKGADGPVKLTLMAHAGRALRSDRTYQDVNGGSFNMANANAVHPRFLNAGLQAGNFNLRYLHESSQVNDRDGSANTVRPADYKNYFYNDSLLMQHRYEANAQIALTPSVLYQQENPRKTVKTDGSTASETSLSRLHTKLPIAWEFSSDWNFAGGLEYLSEEYKGLVRPIPLRKLPFERTDISSLYGEALSRNSWGDITVSARMDEHSHAGLLRAERLGYTKIMGDWHFKLMGSYANRAPSIESYAAKPSPTQVKAETARTWEMETGYRINADTQFTINLFDITTFDTLILTNMQTVHTRGLETEYKIRKEWGDADITYSYYNAAGTDTNFVKAMEDPYASQVADGSMNLAFASHKLTANLHYKLSTAVSLNPSLVYLGPRWGLVAPDLGNGGTLQHFDATPLLNVTLSWANALSKGLDLTLGLYNAFNQKAEFISPMNSYHAPLPDMSREVVVQAQCKF